MTGTFDEFWIGYLRRHRRPGTRAMHYLGTTGALALLALAAARRDSRLALAAPVVGYGMAWLGHALIEHNRPNTFRAPLKSLAGDVHMLGLFAAGRLDAELARAGIAPEPGPARRIASDGGRHHL